MTAVQKLKWIILLRAGLITDEEWPTADELERLYAKHDGENDLCDARNEVRETGEETGLPDREYSRHYECEEVAAQCPDGSWVGWTHWHGGGKHGCPEEMPWIENAYDVRATDEQKLVTVRSFAVAT